MSAHTKAARIPAPGVRSVVEEAYQVFSGYRRSNPLNVCRCPSCVSPEEERLLGAYRLCDIPASVLAAYTNSAHGYDPALDGDTFRHFLPRYFDLIAEGQHPDSFGDAHYCLRRLHLTGFRDAWPEQEVATVDRFFDAIILDGLSDDGVIRLPSGFSPASRVSDLFIMAATAGGDINRLVGLIPLAPDPACAMQLAAMAENVAYDPDGYTFISPLIPSDSPLARALGSVIATPDTLRRFEAAFLAKSDGAIETILARGIDVLSAWFDRA